MKLLKTMKCNYNFDEHFEKKTTRHQMFDETVENNEM